MDGPVSDNASRQAPSASRDSMYSLIFELLFSPLSTQQCPGDNLGCQIHGRVFRALSASATVRYSVPVIVGAAGRATTSTRRPMRSRQPTPGSIVNILSHASHVLRRRRSPVGVQRAGAILLLLHQRAIGGRTTGGQRSFENKIAY